MAKDKQVELNEKLTENENSRIKKGKTRYNEEFSRNEDTTNMNDYYAQQEQEQNSNVANQPQSEKSKAQKTIEEYMTNTSNISFDEEYLSGLSLSLRTLSRDFNLDKNIFDTDVKDCITNTDVVMSIYNNDDNLILSMVKTLDEFKKLLRDDAGKIDKVVILSKVFDESQKV